MTLPVRAAAAAAGDVESYHLWAGRGWREVTEETTERLMARLSAEAGLGA